MTSWKHAVLGATVAVVPDVCLWTFAWERRWVPESDPRVRCHRFLHSRPGLLVVVVLAWTSHIVADWVTHR